MQNENVIEGLEYQMADMKELIARGDMAKKLASNREFKKLILEDFCEKEAARLVQQSGDPALSKEQREDALNMAQASGHLKRYLSTIFQLAERARNTVPEIEEALDEARAESGEAN